MRYYREHMSTEDVLRLSFHAVSKTGLDYVNISQSELLRGYSIRGVEHGVQHMRNTPKRKPPCCKDSNSLTFWS